jgi:hypothetical protein
MEGKIMGKKKHKRPKLRKRWEKRDFTNLKEDGPPIQIDFAGAKAAYAWGKKNGVQVHAEKEEDHYLVWRL